MTLTVDTEAQVRVKASGDIIHLCSYRDETDRGRISVSWKCEGKTFELHELAQYLDGFADKKISHEDLVAEVKADLEGNEGVSDVAVSFETVTAGFDVLVREVFPD